MFCSPACIHQLVCAVPNAWGNRQGRCITCAGLCCAPLPRLHGGCPGRRLVCNTGYIKKNKNLTAGFCVVSPSLQLICCCRMECWAPLSSGCTCLKKSESTSFILMCQLRSVSCFVRLHTRTGLYSICLAKCLQLDELEGKELQQEVPCQNSPQEFRRAWSTDQVSQFLLSHAQLGLLQGRWQVDLSLYC